MDSFARVHCEISFMEGKLEESRVMETADRTSCGIFDLRRTTLRGLRPERPPISSLKKSPLKQQLLNLVLLGAVKLRTITNKLRENIPRIPRI